MYSNSVKRNPIFHKKRAPKVGIGHFSVGCVTESTADDTIPKPIHRTKYVQQNYDIRNNTSRAILEYKEALNYEKNANLNLFSDINKNNKSSYELPAPSIHRRAFYNPPLRNNNTTEETDKPRIIKEHVGATNTNFPTTRIGQELLRQKALMNVNELPSIMKSLINSVKDLKQIRNVKHNSVEEPENAQSTDVSPTPDTLPTSGIPNVKDETRVAEDAQDGDTDIYTNTLKELERVASRLRRNGQIDDRTIEKLIDLDVITREMSSNSVLIQQRIEEYSQFIRDEMASKSAR